MSESAAAREPRLARGVGPYAWTIGVLGVVVATAMAVHDPTIEIAHLPLALCLLIATNAPIRVQSRGGSTHAVTLNESVIVAMLLAAPTGLLPTIVIVMVIATALRRRADITKTAYNCGAGAIATGAAVLAAGAVDLQDAAGQVLAALVVAIIAAGIYQAVELLLITELFRRLSGTRPTESIRDARRSIAITFVFTAFFGALLGIGARFDPAVAWFGPPLLLGLWFALRDLNAAANATRTSLLLHEVTNDIADATSSLATSVGRIAATFGARAVLLRLPGDGLPEELLHDETGLAADDLRGAITRAGDIDRPVQVETDRHAIAVVAPVEAPDGLGHLVVAGTTTQWTEREVALLGTLATHLGTNLRTLTLLDQVTRESRKLTDVVDAAGDGIALIRADGEVATWNPGMARLTGVDGATAIGRPIGQVLTWRDPEDGSRDTALPPALAATLQGEAPAAVDLEVLRADQWRRARCRFSPVHGAGGVTGAVLVARDRSIEADLDQVRDDFVAIVSHEIRTPLTPLKGMVELLDARADAMTAATVRQLTGAMTRQLRRLDDLTSDLLTVARLDRGDVRVVSAPVVLADVCREAVELEVPTDHVDPVILDLDGDVVIEADADALLRVLRALVGNAVKHGGGVIEVTAHADGDEAVAEVRDHGPGIPEWEHAAVFERFRRVGTNLEWTTQGPGLGLAIAAGLTARMGLRLDLESAPGEGARFRVVAPLRSAVEATTEA